MISSRWPCITSNGHSSCRTRLRAVSLEWKFGMELAVICTKDMVKFPKNGHLDMFHNRHRGFFGDLELYREKWGPSQPLGGSEVKVKSTRQPSLLLVYWFYQTHACIPISIRWGCLRIWGYRGYSGWFNPHAAKTFGGCLSHRTERPIVWVEVKAAPNTGRTTADVGFGVHHLAEFSTLWRYRKQIW